MKKSALIAILSVALSLFACSHRGPQAPAASPGPEAAAPPPGHQADAPPPAAAQPEQPKEKSLTSKIPQGWARVGPRQFLNPERQAMIAVNIYRARDKTATQEAEDTLQGAGAGIKHGPIMSSADGSRASVTWTGPKSKKKDEPQKMGKLVVRHLPAADGTPDLMIECLGVWTSKGNADSIKDIDAFADSFAFE